MVKTFHMCCFREVVEACPVPILGLGACKPPTQLRALELAAREVADGVRGVIFGRNALQAPDPLAFQHALCDVVKRDITPEQARLRHGLVD